MTRTAVRQVRRRFSCQLFVRDENTVFIGINPIAGPYRDATNRHFDLDIADAFLHALLWMQCQCTYADVARIDFCRIANATVDDDAGPAIFLRKQAEIAAD